MSGRRLGIIYAALLLLALVALWPLRLALGGSGIGARQATGSIWSGRLEAAIWQGLAIGDMAVGLAPLPLLAGERRVGFSTGALTGSVARTRDGMVLKDLNGQLSPGAVAGLPVEGVQFDGFGAGFDGVRCATATGTLTLRPGGALARNGSFTGLARCDGDRLLLPLQGEGGSIALRIAGDGRYAATVALEGVDAAARPALLAAGFQPTPTGLSFAIEGRF